GTINLERPLNRIESIVLVQRALGSEPAEEIDLPFSDTSDESWYAGNLQSALDDGIVSGNPDGTFSPGDPLSVAAGLKVMLTSMQGVDQDIEDDHDVWYEGYAEIGEDLALLNPEFDDYGRPITRGEFLDWMLYMLE
ncbi:S-layer homology domain-containing protein, partial [Candidatus Peribacteria bacterium]|nr:S-layer homology domain-containing protein [Candidatus Peribacteria bacterium]